MNKRILQRLPHVSLTANALVLWFSGEVKIQHKTRTLSYSSFPLSSLTIFTSWTVDSSVSFDWISWLASNSTTLSFWWYLNKKMCMKLDSLHRPVIWKKKQTNVKPTLLMKEIDSRTILNQMQTPHPRQVIKMIISEEDGSSYREWNVIFTSGKRR